MSDRERDSIQEMEDIQKGLEAFLQQEMQEMQTSGSGSGKSGTGRRTAERPAPQMFDMNEDDEDEEELDVIGSGRRAREDDYTEDWDDPAYRKRQAARRETTRKTAENRNGGGRSNSNEDRRRQAASDRTRRSRREDYADEYEDYEDYRDKKRSGKKSGKREEIDTKTDKKSRKGNKKEAGVTNILLIGNDSRENGEDGRSDAMILLSISNKTKKIYMTSLLRDMYVEIPGYKDNRLNAAYSYGGAELLMETIEQNFDIHISRYVLVNFEAFANLVDAVGGVDLELTGKEVEYVNGYLVEYNILLGRPEGTDYFDDLSGGMVHLNGPQALAYCRNRYIGTDFGRTERQRKVLTEVIHKLPKGVLTNPKGLIDGLMPNLTTNLTQAECYRLSLMAPKILTYDIIQNSIPIEGTYKDATHRKMSVLEVDFEANKKFLQENLYGTGDSTATAASEN